MFNNATVNLNLGDNTISVKSYAYLNKGSNISTTGLVTNAGIAIYISQIDNPAVNLNNIYEQIKTGKDYLTIDNNTKKYTINSVINGMFGSANMQHLELTVI